MSDYIDELVEKHARSGVLLDANLLLLLIIGLTRRDLVGKINCLDAYVPEDVDTLSKLLSFFAKITTLPNIWTEVSNLAGQALTGHVRDRCFDLMADKIRDLGPEILLASTTASEEPCFHFLGLTDAAIANVAKQPLLVLTADGRLATHLERLGLPVLNFNNLRPLGWN